jgi:putative SOS response-associated peptidase YedK
VHGLFPSCRHVEQGTRPALERREGPSQGAEAETTNDIFAFLTTEPDKIVGSIHPKVMPVILTTREEIDIWMTARKR